MIETLNKVRPNLMTDPARKSRAMLLYGVIQAALTTSIATFIGASRLSPDIPSFLWNWMISWLFAWIAMLPVVVLASPLIRNAVDRLVARG